MLKLTPTEMTILLHRLGAWDCVAESLSDEIEDETESRRCYEQFMEAGAKLESFVMKHSSLPGNLTDDEFLVLNDALEGNTYFNHTNSHQSVASALPVKLEKFYKREFADIPGAPRPDPEDKPLPKTRVRVADNPSGPMPFKYDDGGREEAGFKGTAGDCVCRAVAIASGRPYREVYDTLAQGNKSQRVTKRTAKTGRGRRTARSGIYTDRKWFKDYMRSLGAEWISVMSIGTGVTTHLRASELPSGRIIARVSRHYAAVIDGVLHDTHDCSRGGNRAVYGYWKF